MFGNTSTHGTFTFGQNNLSNTNTTSNSGSLFGNTNINTSTGFKFGVGSNTINNVTPTSTAPALTSNSQTTEGFTFGNVNNATNPNNSSGSLFGNSALNSSKTGGLFGQNIKSTFTPSTDTFGTNTNVVSTKSVHSNLIEPTLNQNAPCYMSGPSIQAQLTRIKDNWDPSSPNCAFQYYFYNRVPIDQVPLYQMPPGQSPDKWDKAMAERPYDACVPVLAIGFNDLQKRAKQQKQQVAAYRVRMHEINSKLDQLTNKHDLITTVKIAEMKQCHIRLVNRTVALAAITQVLRNRGYVLKPEEEVLRKNFEALYARITDPAVFGRINEIWARMSVLREQARHFRDHLSKKAPDAILSWDRDEETLEKLAKILKAQQTGIAYLAKVLKEDKAEMDRISDDLYKKSQK